MSRKLHATVVSVHGVSKYSYSRIKPFYSKSDPDKNCDQALNKFNQLHLYWVKQGPIKHANWSKNTSLIFLTIIISYSVVRRRYETATKSLIKAGDINRNPILWTWSVFKIKFGFGRYPEATSDSPCSIAVSKLRSSSHTLTIERGRYFKLWKVA